MGQPLAAMRRAPRRLQQSRTVVWVWAGLFIVLAVLFFTRTSRLPTHSLSVTSRHLFEPGHVLHNVQELVIHTDPIQQPVVVQQEVQQKQQQIQEQPAQPNLESSCTGLQGKAYIECYRQHNPPPVEHTESTSTAEEERHGSLHTGGQSTDDDAQQRDLPHVFLFMGILSGVWFP